MIQLEIIANIIKKDKPYARFDKAPLYRQLDNDHLSLITAKHLIGLLDQKKTIQQFSSSLGRSILSTFEKVGDLEHEVKKNEILCGLTITRGLLNNNILYKRLEKVPNGVDNNGNTTYDKINLGGTFIDKKVWNLYIKEEDFVTAMFWQFPVELNHKSSPSINKPKERNKFFDSEGGHLVTKLNRKYVRLFNKSKIPLIYDHINQLQSIEWRVNIDVLETVEELKKRGHYSYNDPGKQRDFSMAVQYANNVKNSKFYFYWFLDTRGRYYCGSSYLTPQGNKLSKGLLLLNNKKELGSEGLFWLKVHTANVLGFDKIKIEERAELIETHLELIRAIGMNPVDSYYLWKDASEPETFLAACIELYKAYSCNNPTKYESGLMVGQDATCSGIQIMSYITRDEITGALVNLTDSDEIGDVYQFVADFIDWDQDWFWKDYASKMRWLCKRPVMTRYYSAGVEKISEALLNDCKQKGIYPTPEDCEMLAKAIVNACNEQLKGPSKVMKLLQGIGSELSERNQLLFVQGLHNNFPFVQSYTIPQKDRVSFKNGKERLTLTYVCNQDGKINKKRVASGSSPNFIHHLDSQLVSAMISEAEDYTMIPTHDCFYSVPADAGKMFEDSRKCFYNLFGERDYLQEVCDKLKVENTIEYGDLNTQQVLDNQFCFS